MKIETPEVYYCDGVDCPDDKWCQPIIKTLSGEGIILLENSRIYVGDWRLTEYHLPTFEELVLVTNGTFRETGRFSILYDEKTASNTWECRDSLGMLLAGVIAWFPLPELNRTGDVNEKNMRSQ